MQCSICNDDDATSDALCAIDRSIWSVWSRWIDRCGLSSFETAQASDHQPIGNRMSDLVGAWSKCRCMETVDLEACTARIFPSGLKVWGIKCHSNRCSMLFLVFSFFSRCVAEINQHQSQVTVIYWYLVYLLTRSIFNFNLVDGKLYTTKVANYLFELLIWQS